LKKIAIFASGAGSNALKIIESLQLSGRGTVSVILCNKANAAILEKAEKMGIPTILLDSKIFRESDTYVKQLKELGIDLIILAGFLLKVPTSMTQAFENRIINIHPSLLPKYGGKGMYGHHVHEAVLAAGEAESGITIHFVNEHYDEGNIILQARCKVLPNDTASQLAQKVQVLEHFWFPKTVDFVLQHLQ
jgi:phosphoribosylglycinamide formyltransferase-1